MADITLFCPKCQIQFPTSGYDPKRSYRCPRCQGELVPARPSSAGPRRRVEEADEDLPPGARLGTYEIVRKLGQGCLGAVYEAEHIGLVRRCALKVLSAKISAQPGAAKWLQRAAGAAGAFMHPGFVRIYGAGKAQGRYFIETEYVEGEDLQTRVAFDGRMSVADATRFIRGAAAALAAAHQRGLIHRDVKPSNIMVTPDGEVKLTDLGLLAAARAQAPDATPGTPEFMSPEQFENPQVDARGDIYSLGVTYFFLLTAQAPFSGGSALSVMIQHKSEPVPDPRVLRRDLPPTVCHIIRKCMAKNPDERYQRAEEMTADLDGVLEWEVRRGPRAMSAGRKAGLAAAAAAVALAVAGGAYWLLKGEERERPTPPRPTQSTRPASTASARKPDEAAGAVAPTAPIPASTTTAAPRPAPKPGPAAPVRTAKPQPPPRPVRPRPRPRRPLHAAPKIDVAAARLREAIDKLDAELEQMTRAGRYDEALQRCREAAAGPAALAKCAARWREHILACQSVIDDARKQAQRLVGKTYRAVVRVGAKGRMTLTGVVQKFENDEIHLRVGRMDKVVPLSKLEPDALAALATGDRPPTPLEQVRHARLLLTVGKEAEAMEMLRRAASSAKTDPEAAAAYEQAKAFFEDWRKRQEREAVERRAAEAVEQVKRDYAAGKWDAAIAHAASARRAFASTKAYVRQARLVDLLAQLAARRKALAAAQKNRLGLWRRWGPQITGPDGSSLPAGKVHAAAMLPGGELLAVAHSFGLDLWDLRTRKLARRLDGHAAAVTALAISPSGSRLATGSLDQIVCLWDANTGRRLHTLRGHEGRVNALAFSPDGLLLASAANDPEVRLWDVKTGARAASIRGGRFYVFRVRFSPSGKLLLTLSYDRTVRVWDVRTRRLLQTLRSKPGVRDAWFGRREKMLISTDFDGFFRLWDLKSGKEVRAIRAGRGWRLSLSSHPKKDLLATCAGDGRVRLWRLPSGQRVGELAAAGQRFYGVEFSPDGRWLAAAAGPAGVIAVWDLKRRSRAPARLLTAAGAVYRVRFSPDGRWLTACPRHAGVDVFKLPKGTKCPAAQGYAAPVRAMALSPDGERLAYQTTRSDRLRIERLAKPERRPVWARRERLSPIAFSPDGEQLTCSQDDRLDFFNARTGRRVAWFAPQRGARVTAFAWSAAGDLLAIGLRSGEVRVWLKTQGKQRIMAGRHRRPVVSVAFDPAGKLLASLDRRGEVKVWDIKTGAAVSAVQANSRLAAFGPDGEQLACGRRREIVFFRTATGEETRTIGLDDFELTAMAPARKGRWLALGGRSGRVRVLDAKSGRVLYEFAEHREPITVLSCSRKEPTTIAAASEDGWVSVWRLGASSGAGGSTGAADLAWLTDLFKGDWERQPIVVDLSEDHVVSDLENLELTNARPASSLAGAAWRWTPTQPGERLDLRIMIPSPGKYLVGVRMEKGPTAGVLQLQMAGEDVGEPQDCYQSERRAGAVVRFGEAKLREGENIVSLICRGKNPASAGQEFDIDALILWPQP